MRKRKEMKETLILCAVYDVRCAVCGVWRARDVRCAVCGELTHTRRCLPLLAPLRVRRRSQGDEEGEKSRA